MTGGYELEEMLHLVQDGSTQCVGLRGKQRKNDRLHLTAVTV
jgi:hypothetical protein